MARLVQNPLSPVKGLTAQVTVSTPAASIQPAPLSPAGGRVSPFARAPGLARAHLHPPSEFHCGSHKPCHVLVGWSYDPHHLGWGLIPPSVRQPCNLRGPLKHVPSRKSGVGLSVRWPGHGFGAAGRPRRVVGTEGLVLSLLISPQVDCRGSSPALAQARESSGCGLPATILSQVSVGSMDMGDAEGPGAGDGMEAWLLIPHQRRVPRESGPALP